MMKSALKAIWHLLALLGLCGVVAGVWLFQQGIGTRAAPSAAEAAVARAARQAMIPAAARARLNPEPTDADTLRAGLEHWADHCASCHANDGSGNTEMGQGLYPRVPDMRHAATQDLTDGELFYIIENGVKMTGMPAWGTGTPDGERASWHLVQLIRRLPALSDGEIAEMEALNPRSASEWRALEEERRFLSGESPLPTDPGESTHRHKEFRNDPHGLDRRRSVYDRDAAQCPRRARAQDPGRRVDDSRESSRGHGSQGSKENVCAR
ncbi:MAG: c-type cytochrome [Vicinamibacterales bacterium]